MAFLNLGFETAGATPGSALHWTQTIVAGAQGFLDFSGGFGGRQPTESFEWGAPLLEQLSPGLSVDYTVNPATSTFFAPAHPLTANLDVEIPSGAPGGITAGQTYYVVNPTTNTFQLATTPGGTAVTITSGPDNGTVVHNGTSQLLAFGSGSFVSATEHFDGGWGGRPASPFLFNLSLTVDAAFAEGTAVEHFGDTFIASVSGSTFTVSSAPDNSTPIQFGASAPGGVTAGATYYTRDATSTTFAIAATPGGTALVVSDATGVEIDVARARGSSVYSNVTASVVAATDRFTASSAISSGQELVFLSAKPAGMPSSHGYAVNAAGSTFQVALAPGGVPIDITADAAGLVVNVGVQSGLDASIATPLIFAEGGDTDTDGSELVVSVVTSTSTFTATSAALAPEQNQPVTFKGLAPLGATVGTTYYAINVSGATFQLATTPGGFPIAIGADETGLRVDLGLRSDATGLITGFSFTRPDGSTLDTEGFEDLAGSFPFVVDTATSVVTAVGHPFVNNSPIQFVGPGLPAATPQIVAGLTYFAVNVSGSTFQVATTISGSPISITGGAGDAATVEGDPTAWWNQAAP